MPGQRVRMCRGCCCGTARKHPDVDHDAIAEILATMTGPNADLIRVDCLWACDQSNVVVVNPDPEARRNGAKPAWLTHVNTLDRAHALAAWVRAGGPGRATPPAELGEIHNGTDIRTVGSTSR